MKCFRAIFTIQVFWGLLRTYAFGVEREFTHASILFCFV